MLNKTAKILLYSSTLWNLGDGMLGPLFAIFAQKVGGNILDITWAWATYLVVMGIFTVLVGKVSDRFQKEKIMIVGYAMTAMLTFCYVLVSSPWHLFLVQAGLGVAIALCNPTWYALYSKYTDHDNGGYIWGLADGLNHIVLGIAIMIGGLIVQYFSFDALFVTMGTIQTVATLYQLQILKTKKDDRVADVSLSDS